MGAKGDAGHNGWILKMRQEHLTKFVVAPFAIGLLARLVGSFAIVTVYGIHSAINGAISVPEHGAMLSGYVAPSDSVWFHVITILILSPAIENIIVLLSGEWLRSSIWKVVLGSMIAGSISFLIHGMDLSSVAAALAFIIFTVYYAAMRNRHNGVAVSFILRALAHSHANLIAYINGILR
jgi:hypothetical protein